MIWILIGACWANASTNENAKRTATMLLNRGFGLMMLAPLPAFPGAYEILGFSVKVRVSRLKSDQPVSRRETVVAKCILFTREMTFFSE
jgi:hypothetical protein